MGMAEVMIVQGGHRVKRVEGIRWARAEGGSKQERVGVEMRTLRTMWGQGE